MCIGRACRQAQRSRQFRKHLELQSNRSKCCYFVPLILSLSSTSIFGIAALAALVIAILSTASREQCEHCITFLTFLSTVERSISAALWGYHYILSKFAPPCRNDALPFKCSSAKNTGSSRRCRRQALSSRRCRHRHKPRQCSKRRRWICKKRRRSRPVCGKPVESNALPAQVRPRCKNMHCIAALFDVDLLMTSNNEYVNG